MERSVIDLAREPDFTIGGLAVHPSTREVSQGGVRDVVEPRVMQVLVALAQARGAVVSKDDLLLRCWDGRIVGEDAINRVMSRLRRLSETTGAFRIETVTRVGYRLVQTGGETDEAPSAASVEVASEARSPRAVRALPRRALVFGGVALAAAAGTGLWSVLGNEPDASRAKSVAVVPFRALDGPAQRYFSEGLAQEISVELASMPGMKVLASTSVALAVKQASGLAELAKRLGADLLLSGTVQRQADALRVTCELVDTHTGLTTWADRFDRQAQDIFEIQSEITRQVAGIVSIEAAPAATLDANGRGLGGTRNTEAHDAYLRGADLLERGLGEASDRAAAGAFERALALDPKFAKAQVELAMAYASLGMYGSATSATAASNLTKALQLAQGAIRLAPDLPIANARLGYILVVARYDFAAAARYFRRALELGPGIAIIQSAFALFASLVGRTGGAEAAIARAIEIDPLNPARRRIATQIALLNHDYPRAVARAAEALALDADGSLVNGYLGDALIMLQRFAEARDAYRAETSELIRWTGLAIASFHLGERDAARAWLDRLQARYGEFSAYQQAQVFAQWNDQSAAATALEIALRASDTGLTLILRDPLLKPLHGHPTYRQVVQRMRFV